MPRATDDSQEPPSPTGPVFVWLLIQSAALIVALLGLPLSAAYPRNGELLAAQVIVVTQFTAAALLFPYLTQSRGAALAVIAVSWPFILLGGVFSAVAIERMIACAGYLAAWLVALWTWRAAAGAQVRYAVAITSLLTVGGLILRYLMFEFSAAAADPASHGAANWISLSPPLAAIRMLTGPSQPFLWAIPGALCGAALALLASRGAPVRLSTISKHARLRNIRAALSRKSRQRNH